MGDTDAKPMVPDQPVKEQIKPKRSNSKTKTLAPSQIKELVEGDLPTLEKPLWVDEPKPFRRKTLQHKLNLNLKLHLK